nr:CPBP family intramembrane glutamic endopeptidase [uncultured Mediterraneibacter sp.]
MNEKKNYLFAVLVFAFTMLGFNGISMVLSFAAAIGGTILGGANGSRMTYQFLMNHLNLVSVLVYTVMLVFAFCWYYFAFIEREGVIRFFKRRVTRVDAAGYGWLFVLGFGLLQMSSIVMTVIALAAPKWMENYQNLIDNSGVTEYSVTWLIGTLILPPLVEEMIFRGMIMGYIQRAGAGFVVANLVQAVLFGVFHQNLVQGIYTALFGLVLGYVADRYGTLFASMFLHMTFNFFGTVFVDLEQRFLPDVVTGMLVLVGIPLAVVALTVISARCKRCNP